MSIDHSCVEIYEYILEYHIIARIWQKPTNLIHHLNQQLRGVRIPCRKHGPKKQRLYDNIGYIIHRLYTYFLHIIIPIVASLLINAGLKQLKCMINE